MLGLLLVICVLLFIIFVFYTLWRKKKEIEKQTIIYFTKSDAVYEEFKEAVDDFQSAIASGLIQDGPVTEEVLKRIETLEGRMDNLQDEQHILAGRKFNSFGFNWIVTLWDFCFGK